MVPMLFAGLSEVIFVLSTATAGLPDTLRRPHQDALERPDDRLHRRHAHKQLRWFRRRHRGVIYCRVTVNALLEEKTRARAADSGEGPPPNGRASVATGSAPVDRRNHQSTDPGEALTLAYMLNRHTRTADIASQQVVGGSLRRRPTCPHRLRRKASPRPNTN